MDFEAAVKAHTDYKIKLTKYIRHPDKSLKADEICKDNACDLGKWLHGEGKNLCGDKPEFGELLTAHASFHQQAGDIVRRADKGEQVAEEMSLGSASQYAQTSNKVVQLIMAIRRKCGK